MSSVARWYAQIKWFQNSNSVVFTFRQTGLSTPSNPLHSQSLVSMHLQAHTNQLTAREDYAKNRTHRSVFVVNIQCSQTRFSFGNASMEWIAALECRRRIFILIELSSFPQFDSIQFEYTVSFSSLSFSVFRSRLFRRAWTRGIQQHRECGIYLFTRIALLWIRSIFTCDNYCRMFM